MTYFEHVHLSFGVQHNCTCQKQILQIAIVSVIFGTVARAFTIFLNITPTSSSDISLTQKATMTSMLMILLIFSSLLRKRTVFY